MLLEPLGRQARDFLKRSRFLEEMRSTGNDAQLLLAPELIVSLPIQSHDFGVESSDNEQC